MSIPQTSAEPISDFSQLAEFLEKGCKPKNLWKIGTEHEKFGYVKRTKLPLPYSGVCSITSMLEGLSEKFNWTKVFEGKNLIGLEKNGANVSLEPGGQLELSGAPLDTIYETCDEANVHLKEVREIAEKIGAGFIGLGAAPTWSHKEMPKMPKGRYRLMSDYMDKVGTHGKQMMYRTCTVQVNLDFSSEQDMVKKFRVSLSLQPIATALFANSPFFNNSVNNHKSWRSRIWRSLDSSRTGMLPFVFENGMGFERYVDYALDVPMYFVYRNGKYLNALGQSFRDFLKGELPSLPGEIPRISDWADHLTTIFPEVRLKQFLEMRGADSGSWNNICALPAFWVGVLYDSDSLEGAWDICKNWTDDDREGLRQEAALNGLAGAYNKISISDITKKLLYLSKSGLIKRGKISNNKIIANESHFLEVLDRNYELQTSPADELLKKYYSDWAGNLDKIYDEYSY